MGNIFKKFECTHQFLVFVFSAIGVFLVFISRYIMEEIFRIEFIGRSRLIYFFLPLFVVIVSTYAILIEGIIERNFVKKEIRKIYSVMIGISYSLLMAWVIDIYAMMFYVVINTVTIRVFFRNSYLQDSN